MAEDGRYYWLKLKRDFFKRHDVRIVEAMPNGKDYLIFYLKLLCESIDHEGFLRFSETIPYNENMLAAITNTNIDIVRTAIEIFSELDLLEIMDDGTYYMNKVNSMIGSAADNDNANRQRRYREKQKQLAMAQNNDNFSEMLHERYASVTKNNESKRIEKDIEIEKDIDIHSNECIPAREAKHRHGEYQKILLTDKEYEKLVTDYGQELTEKAISYVDEYIARKGAKYKSHYLVIKKWGIDAVKEQQAKRSTNKTAQSLDEFYDMAASWAESEAHDGT